MNFVIIYADMVGATQALEIEAESWDEAKIGVVQRLRDNQRVAEGVDRNSLQMFPAMIIKADNVEVKRITAYVSNDGEELCDYTENFMRVYEGPADPIDIYETAELEEDER